MKARLFGALSVLLVSGAAWACPVCGAATDTKGTYQATTLVMSGLPLAMLGALVFFVGQRMRRAAREEQVASSLPPRP